MAVSFYAGAGHGPKSGGSGGAGGTAVESVYTDLRYAKIYNRFVLPCVPAGILILGIAHGWQGVLFSAEGIGIGAIALLVASSVRWLAPGDAKLIVAVGALMGPGFVGATMLYGALAGGVAAVGIMLRRRLLAQWATQTAVALSARIPVSATWSARAGYMPYSLAIACGAIVAWFVPIWEFRV